MNRLEFIKKVLILSDKELEEVIRGKDSTSIFVTYMAARNFEDYGYHIFKEHNMDMHTRLPNNRKVDGCSCLYDVLLRNPFRYIEDKDLFSFIRNSLILNRDLKDVGLKEGELL